MATACSVNARSRPWSEWAATPPATWRAKWRAAMVPMSAPQMPVFSSASLPTRRQGPIEQMRQQAPDSPMGQGFMVSARENAVSIPQPSACASISRAAGSMLFAATGLASSLVLSSMRRLLHARAGTGRDVRAARAPGRIVDGGCTQDGRRSVLAVVARHREVGRVGGGDAHAGRQPRRLVRRRRVGVGRLTDGVAGLLELGGDLLRVGLRRVVLETSVASIALAPVTWTSSASRKRPRTAITWWSAHMPGTIRASCSIRASSRERSPGRRPPGEAGRRPLTRNLGGYPQASVRDCTTWRNRR